MKKWCKLFISASILIGRTRRIGILGVRTISRCESAAGATTLSFLSVSKSHNKKKKKFVGAGG